MAETDGFKIESRGSDQRISTESIERERPYAAVCKWGLRRSTAILGRIPGIVSGADAPEKLGVIRVTAEVSTLG